MFSSLSTVNKMGPLLQLADEYQTKGVHDLCVKCLTNEPKSVETAVKILSLANRTVMTREDSRLDGVRGQCYEIIENMELVDIREKTDYKNLDQESLENVLVKRTERLETSFRKIIPQFFGLVECCLWSCMEHDEARSFITPCPQHFSGVKPNLDLQCRIKDCSVCRRMINQLVSFLLVRKESSGLGFSAYGSNLKNPEYKYGGSHHFDNELITIIQDFQNLFKNPITPIATSGSTSTSFPGSFLFTPQEAKFK